MEVTEYILEIYEPGGRDLVILAVKSTTPFMAIRRGDIINPATLGTFSDFPDPGISGVLRVVNVEHILSRTEWRTEKLGIKHKICVSTREEPNTIDTYLDTGKEE